MINVDVDIVVAIIAASATIGATIITSIVSFKKLKSTVKFDMEKFKSESTYEIKKKAIFESLQMLDSYFSWLDFNSNIKPERDFEITQLELTKKARTVYNQLLVTCTSGDLPNKFVEIIFGKEKNKLCLYKEYRNECRHELGFDSIDMNEESIFISIVSTEALKKNRK